MKTIIEMAREAGFNPDDFDNQDCECEECNFLRPMLERFAALVREDGRENRQWRDLTDDEILDALYADNDTEEDKKMLIDIFNTVITKFKEINK